MRSTSCKFYGKRKFYVFRKFLKMVFLLGKFYVFRKISVMGCTPGIKKSFDFQKIKAVIVPPELPHTPERSGRRGATHYRNFTKNVKFTEQKHHFEEFTKVLKFTFFEKFRADSGKHRA